MRSLVVGSLLTLMLVLAACGGGSSQAKRTGPSQPLVIVPNCGGDLVQNFNPFSVALSQVNSYGVLGPVYETLLFFNRADGSIHPWLADSYSYSSDATTITFKLHKGIQWSDGQPFTAADVAFTLELIKQNPAIDPTGVVSGSIQQVTSSDPLTVVVTLTSPSSSILWSLAGQTWIVPQHIWASVGDPSKYTDTNPVGTGPYVFKSFTPQLIDFTKNPHFWQPGKPVVPEIRFPSCHGNTDAWPAMLANQTDWNTLFPLDPIDKAYVQRDPAHNHWYFAPSDPVMLFLNLTKAPFNQLTVRKAISLALDRSQISTVGESGYEPVAHPTGLILPANQQFLDPTYANAAFSLDPTQASQILASAGFTKGSDGILVGPGGKKFSVNLDVQTGYTDWIADCQIIASNLKAIGIQVNINQDSVEVQDLQNGTYDMAIWGETPGPTPYYIYQETFASSNSAPIGQAATSNFERWNDPATDTLLNQYNSTVTLAQQQQAMYGIEKIAVEQMPVIFLVNEPYWYEYNTLKYVGWPDKSNPYAEGAAYAYPDDEIVLLNLHQ